MSRALPEGRICPRGAIELFHGKTILQDNVRFHHALIIKEYAKINNINMEYIPAYSPDFNPIVRNVIKKLCFFIDIAIIINFFIKNL
jgi:transposase